MFRVVLVGACLAAALSAASPSIAATVFQIPLADGTRSSPGATDYNWNGNEYFQEIESFETYGASHVVLGSRQTINHLGFTGIIKWNPENPAYRVAVSWIIYNDDGSYLNSSTPSSLGTIYRLGGPVAAQPSGGITHLGQLFENFSANMPKIVLPAGKYFVALHATVYLNNVATAQKIYWANDYGDGDWAWNSADKHTEWVNPNPAVFFGDYTLTLSN